MKKSFIFFALLLLGSTVSVSAQDATQRALAYLGKNFDRFGLEVTDVADLQVTDAYRSPDGTEHVYLTQRVNGLPVLNAQASVHVRQNRVVHTTNRLVRGLADVPALAPAFSAQTSVSKAAKAVTAAFGTPVATGTNENGKLLFDWPALSPEPVRVTEGYFITDAGLRRVFSVVIDRHAADSDYWRIVLDAQNGEVLAKNNYVLTCNFGNRDHGHQHNYDNACVHTSGDDLPVSEQMFQQAFTVEASSYNVFPFGEESPIHGEREIVTSPAHPVASPFGWHDTNGVEGPEFTITRGNNTWSYPDRDGDDEPDDLTVDGGDSLVFNEAYATEVSADSLLPGALVQTFYYTNVLHDWLYMAGFDEPSGNFQRKNYTEEGRGRDEVRVEAQDGSGTNNANFATPPDGSNGVMQMFLWTGTNSALSITEPAPIAGSYPTGRALFGPEITNEPLTAPVKIVEPALACTDVTNDLTGHIALVTRGDCNFSLKIFNAQQAGAVGVIICNDARQGEDRGGIINMSNGNPELDINIPAVFITFESCVELRNTVASGTPVMATFRTPPPIDGDYDNGIVAHELGHGVSNRLVGGPNNASCLFNDEQMGEGWSDFFALAASPKTIDENPTGAEPRGIGNYATRNGLLGPGIRNRPYSTDLSVNEQTYYNVIISGDAPHPLGEIWAATLWDLYWAMVDIYEFDDDLIDGDGGNNRAVKLVVEGLKYTACSPGLVDGRDGILAADEALYNSENACLIWEVFARRGIGFSADQGSSRDRTDNRSAFDVSPYCTGGVQLTKSVDADEVNAGESVTISLRVENFEEATLSKISLDDKIPAGLTVDPNSIRGTSDFSITGTTISFGLDDLDFEDVKTITYDVVTDPSLMTTVNFFDGAEDGDRHFEIDAITPNFDEVDIFWFEQDTTPYAGEVAWYVPNVAYEQDMALQTADPYTVTGTNPALRFFTQYNTEAAWDAGIVEISANGGSSWERVDDKIIRGDYRGIVAPNSNSVLANVPSFWGNSEGYRDIIIDLSAYNGQEILVRWRWVSDASVSGRGWWVDNIAFIDYVSYDSEATFTSDLASATATIGDLGVVVMGTNVSSNDPQLGTTDVSVYPNPTDDLVTVEITNERAGKADVQLLSVDGRLLANRTLSLVAGGGRVNFSTESLSAGVYVVRVSGAAHVSTTKLTVR